MPAFPKVSASRAPPGMKLDGNDGNAPETPPGAGSVSEDGHEAHERLPSALSEMAERHNTKQILKLARDLVYKVQTLIENK